MDLELTSPLATGLLILAALAGYQYRICWKNEGPAWKLWVFGLVAGLSLLTLGFVPLRAGG